MEQSNAVETAQKDFEEKKNKLLAQMNEMEEKGKLYMLTTEEQQLLHTFKQFKASLRKPKVFKWMTQPYAIGD